MPAGRPRKPDELKVLDGTWRPDRDGDPATSIVATGGAEPPADLRGAALKLWTALVPDLLSRGLARGCDSLELAELCRWLAEYQRIVRAMARMPVSHKRYYQTLVARSISWQNADRIAARFGLTPSDRSKLRSLDKPKQSEAGVSGFARKRG